MANNIVTIESLEAEITNIRERIRKRNERIDNCEVESTDCFMSAYSDRMHIDLCNCLIDILKNDCTAWFAEYATLEGELVNARWVDTRYGRKLVANMPNGETVWTTARTAKGLAKHGLKMVNVRRIAWAKLVSAGNSWTSGCRIKVYPAKLNRLTGEYSDEIEAIEVEDYKE